MSVEGGDEGVSWLLVMEMQSSREREPTPVGQQGKAPSEPRPSVSNNIAKVHKMCDNLKPRSPYLVMGLETPRENPTKGAACTAIPHRHRGQNTPLPAPSILPPPSQPYSKIQSLQEGIKGTGSRDG